MKIVNSKTLSILVLGSVVALASPAMAQEKGKAGTDSGVSRGLDSGVSRGLDTGVNRGLDSGVNRGLDSGTKRGQDTGRTSTERSTNTGSRIPH